MNAAALFLMLEGPRILLSETPGVARLSAAAIWMLLEGSALPDPPPAESTGAVAPIGPLEPARKVIRAGGLVLPSVRGHPPLRDYARLRHLDRHLEQGLPPVQGQDTESSSTLSCRGFDLPTLS
jgi:hypothetical protein